MKINDIIARKWDLFDFKFQSWNLSYLWMSWYFINKLLLWICQLYLLQVYGIRENELECDSLENAIISRLATKDAS